MEESAHGASLPPAYDYDAYAEGVLKVLRERLDLVLERTGYGELVTPYKVWELMRGFFPFFREEWYLL